MCEAKRGENQALMRAVRSLDLKTVQCHSQVCPAGMLGVVGSDKLRNGDLMEKSCPVVQTLSVWKISSLFNSVSRI